MKDLDLGKRTHFSVEELEINWILMTGKIPFFPGSIIKIKDMDTEENPDMYITICIF